MLQRITTPFFNENIFQWERLETIKALFACNYSFTFPVRIPGWTGYSIFIATDFGPSVEDRLFSTALNTNPNAPRPIKLPLTISLTSITFSSFKSKNICNFDIVVSAKSHNESQNKKWAYQIWCNSNGSIVLTIRWPNLIDHFWFVWFMLVQYSLDMERDGSPEIDPQMFERSVYLWLDTNLLAKYQHDQHMPKVLLLCIVYLLEWILIHPIHRLWLNLIMENESPKYSIATDQHRTKCHLVWF